MCLYVCQIEENVLITHDGEFQLGFHKISLEEFLKNAKVKYQETYWIPDIVSKRYKKTNYQKHLKSASIGTKIDE